MTCPANIPSPVGSIRTCIAAASGPCASTPASGPPKKATAATAICCRKGITGLSVAFDLPTQMGMDSDHPLAAGEVGRVGVAICSLADMQRLFEGIRLAGITTSMTINSTAAILLCFYVLVAEQPGRGSCARSPAPSRTTF